MCRPPAPEVLGKPALSACRAPRAPSAQRRARARTAGRPAGRDRWPRGRRCARSRRGRTTGPARSRRAARCRAASRAPPPITCGRCSLSVATVSTRTPARQLVGRAMLVERLRRDAVRVALHHQRPVGEDRQDERRHAHVVAEQVALAQRPAWSAHGGQNSLPRLVTSSRSPPGRSSVAVAAAVLDVVELGEQPGDCGLGQRRGLGSVGRHDSSTFAFVFVFAGGFAANSAFAPRFGATGSGAAGFAVDPAFGIGATAFARTRFVFDVRPASDGCGSWRMLSGLTSSRRPR